MTAPLATIKPIIYIRRENNFLTKTKGILSTNKANSHCDTVHSICCRMSLEFFLKVLTFDFLENLRLSNHEHHSFKACKFVPIGRVQNGCSAQVFGELHLYQGKTVVNVHLASDARGLDCAAYYRAVCRIQSHLPCNVHRR